MKTIKDTKYGDMTRKNYSEDIYLYNAELTSLEGFPDNVNADVFVQHNLLTTLKGGPDWVGGDFDCSDNKLINLIGSPAVVGGDFICNNSDELVSLEGGPKKCVTLYLDKCPRLKNIKEQVIKYQIEAYNYVTDDGKFKFDEIKEEFNEYALSTRVTRKSMRTLLGLDK